jgi:hypothetical protein
VSDAELIDRIESIRARNNTHWMNLVRLAFELAPDRARSIMQEIERLDGEVRALTAQLAGCGNPPPPSEDVGGLQKRGL